MLLGEKVDETADQAKAPAEEEVAEDKQMTATELLDDKALASRWTKTTDFVVTCKEDKVQANKIQERRK